MTHIDWNFPLYLIPNHQGYAAVADNDPLTGEPEPDQSLLLFSDESSAIMLIAAFELLSAPKPLRNERELVWLLQSLKSPVHHVLLDPNPVQPASDSGRKLPIDQVLQQLKPDLSPWNYPVYAVAVDEGFLTIDGTASSGETLSALALFASKEKVDDYLRQAGTSGRYCEIADRQQAIVFFRAVRELVSAVALDPQIENGRHTARYGFSLDTLLEKYLVEMETEG